jgi:hypothetical protein
VSLSLIKFYYCYSLQSFLSIKGIRPDLILKTADGATLLQSDPVALILSLTEENIILSEILEWKLPSLSKRYIEACTELKCCKFILSVKKNKILTVLTSHSCRPRIK